MALNIKNEEVHRLIEQLAELTGESQTSAVRLAVQEKLERLKNAQEEHKSKVMRIAHECAVALGDSFRSLSGGELDELLYDANGLPK